jgi:hypothetical protein
MTGNLQKDKVVKLFLIQYQLEFQRFLAHFVEEPKFNCHNFVNLNQSCTECEKPSFR